jgi:photosystem II stability/assembly factor-like uncharacterized protein
MRSEHEPAAGNRIEADGDSFEDERVEPLQSRERGASRPSANAPAPGWTQRLSLRGKLARAFIVALAMIVALIVLLPRSTFTLPPQLTQLLTPAPPSFSTSAFERVHPPVDPGADTTWLTPSPRNPATAFDCAYPRQTGGPVSGAMTLWVTHDVGQTWSRIALPEVTGTYCEVDAALDGSQRLVMSAANAALAKSDHVCANSRFYLSDDDGTTWRSIVPPSLAPPVSQNSDCFMLVTAKHLFLTTVGNANFERSDDGGQTWQRADYGLPDGAARGFPQLLDATGETLITFDTPYDAAGRLTLWMSPDAGANWRAESVAWPTPLRGSGPIEDLFTEGPLGALPSTPQACHCVVGVSYGAVGEHLYLSQNHTQLTQWTPLPPLPVKGASAERSGVYRVLGLTADGRLLVVGADLDAGVPEILAGVAVSGPLPRLWAWNTHTGRWELAPTQLPCQDLYTCVGDDARAVPPAQVSIRLDANGRLAGTSLWFILGGWRRLSIPAS